jgi:hypothetical protein
MSPFTLELKSYGGYRLMYRTPTETFGVNHPTIDGALASMTRRLLRKAGVRPTPAMEARLIAAEFSTRRF